jgi:hypothetical protein
LKEHTDANVDYGAQATNSHPRKAAAHSGKTGVVAQGQGTAQAGLAAGFQRFRQHLIVG